MLEDRRKRTPFKDLCGGLDRLGYGDQPILSNGSQGKFWSHRARTDLGYEPEFTIKSGVRAYADWMKTAVLAADDTR